MTSFRVIFDYVHLRLAIFGSKKDGENLNTIRKVFDAAICSSATLYALPPESTSISFFSAYRSAASFSASTSATLST